MARAMADLVWALSVVLAVVLGGLLLLWGRHCSAGWRGPSKSGARLPKGSLGWPFIGETLAFLRNPETFASSHVRRYGKIFKTSLLGEPVIMGLTPQFTKFITTSGLFVSSYSEGVQRVHGRNAVMFIDGPRHMSLKKILQKPLLPDALRTKVDTLETIILENMASWEQRGTVIGRNAMKEMTKDTGIWLSLGMRNMGGTPEEKKVMKCLEHIDNAIFGLPLNLPGTVFNKGLKAKASLLEYFKDIVEKRKQQANSQADVLGALLAAQEDPQACEEVKDFDIDMIANNVVVVWFAAYETTSTTLIWILKLLVDHPEVFRRIQAEQQEILKSKDLSEGGPRLSWEDTRKMVYTQKFFNEVQRYRTLVFYLARRATRDIEYEGHLIPNGWLVGWIQHFIHSDPDLFSEPESFNPDRFDTPQKPNSYLPFSGGPHVCPGIETAKLISLIFIHHLTTSYIYESAGPDKGIEYNPFSTPRGGYPINIRRRN